MLSEPWVYDHLRQYTGDYRMSDVEREYLDSYFTDKKAKTEPNAKDDEFFVRFCISQILKSKDLDVDELASTTVASTGSISLWRGNS